MIPFGGLNCLFFCKSNGISVLFSAISYQFNDLIANVTPSVPYSFALRENSYKISIVEFIVVLDVEKIEYLCLQRRDVQLKLLISGASSGSESFE